jgi:hypothetical protein
VSDDFTRRLAPLDVDPRTNAVLVALTGLLDVLQRVAASLGLNPGVHPRLSEASPLNSPS